MTTHRTERVAALICDELRSFILTDINDPRIRTLNITNVVLSGDLKHARIYFSSQNTLTKDQETQVFRVLRHAEGFLRKHLGEKLPLRFVPILQFCKDEHTEKVQRLLSLIDESQMKHP